MKRAAIIAGVIALLYLNASPSLGASQDRPDADIGRSVESLVKKVNGRAIDGLAAGLLAGIRSGIAEVRASVAALVDELETQAKATGRANGSNHIAELKRSVAATASRTGRKAGKISTGRGSQRLFSNDEAEVDVEDVNQDEETETENKDSELVDEQSEAGGEDD